MNAYNRNRELTSYGRKLSRLMSAVKALELREQSWGAQRYAVEGPEYTDALGQSDADYADIQAHKVTLAREYFAAKFGANVVPLNSIALAADLAATIERDLTKRPW